jgi:hypothetical protein
MSGERLTEKSVSKASSELQPLLVLPAIVSLVAAFAALAQLVTAGHISSFDRYVFLLFRRSDDLAVPLDRPDSKKRPGT